MRRIAITMDFITIFTNDASRRYRQAPKIMAHVTENVIDRLPSATSRHKGIRETILLLKLTNLIT